MAIIYGTNMSELLYGTQDNDIIQGFAGNDILYGFGGGDWIFGGTGNDNIKGGDGADFVYGQSGEDFLEGGNGDDSLNGGSQNDKLFGNDGNDSLMGGGGEDQMDGGAGIDWADYSDSSSVAWVSLKTGFALSHAAPGFSVLDGEMDTLTNIENITGSDHNDWLQGSDGKNTIHGGEGDDRLEGHGGDDNIWGEDGNDELFGDAGNDKLRPGLGDATVHGGAGRDTLILDTSPTGKGWNINLEVGTGTQQKPFVKVAAEAKVADIYYDKEDDLRSGRDAFDGEIEIARNLDTEGLWPFPDHPGQLDWLGEAFGAEPAMEMLGRLDFDLPGFDDKPELETFFPNNPSKGPVLQLIQYWKLDIDGIEDVVGSDGNDKIIGNALDNNLYAMGGDDLLDGQGGNDFLFSNHGDVTMKGGAGDDILNVTAYTDHAELTGGSGADDFVFEVNNMSVLGNRGTITDFEQGDIIDIFDQISPANLTFIGDGIFTGVGPQARVDQNMWNPNATLQVDSTGNGLIDWTIDIVKTDPTYMLTDADFLV